MTSMPPFAAAAASLALNEAILLAIMLVILAGAMLMPLLAGAARVGSWLLGFAIRAGVTEAVSAARLEILKWIFVTLLALFGLGFAHAASAESLAAKAGHSLPDSAASAIERLMPAISRALNHPAAQVAGLALRGVTAYQLYVLRRDVAEIRQTTLAMLQDISGVIARVERGEQLSAAQWAEAHDRLDRHAARLRSLEERMDGVEDKVRAILVRLSWRTCPTYHKRVGKACVDARTLPE